MPTVTRTLPFLEIWNSSGDRLGDRKHGAGAVDLDDALCAAAICGAASDAEAPNDAPVQRNECQNFMGSILACWSEDVRRQGGEVSAFDG